MATSSFDEMMVIDTPEKARNLEAAFRAAEKRGPLKFDGPSFDEIIKDGEDLLEKDPEWLNRLIADAKKWAEENGVILEQLEV